MRIGVIISDEPRINDEIRVSQVRLIGPNRWESSRLPSH